MSENRFYLRETVRARNHPYLIFESFAYFFNDEIVPYKGNQHNNSSTKSENSWLKDTTVYWIPENKH